MQNFITYVISLKFDTNEEVKGKLQVVLRAATGSG